MITKNDFDPLKELLLKETKGKNVYYLANPGNWGDGLIRYGTKLFFEDIGLEHKELSPKKSDWIIPFIKGGVVIYGGGGAWCKNWQNTYVEKLSKRFKVIVLPSTYESEVTIKNTTFFARDKYQSLANIPTPNFMHDMAFYIGSRFYKKNEGSGSGYFYREDKESSGKIELDKNNVDISHKGDHYTPVEGFFEEIDKYAVIYTDRLHVAIASVLLKKTVHWYPGNYFKSEAIYNSSIKDNYENVYFHNE
tara:strand:- start:1223 stop:1969 length:747 start_codon:yes stop_codon:yes gene_type:complete